MTNVQKMKEHVKLIRLCVNAQNAVDKAMDQHSSNPEIFHTTSVPYIVACDQMRDIIGVNVESIALDMRAMSMNDAQLCVMELMRI